MKYLPLKEFCKMYQPPTISTKEMIPNGEFPVYGANGQIGRYDKYNHKESQLLITCRGATCGSVNISEPFSWINGNAMVVQPSPEVATLEYMKYAFLGGIDVSSSITGSAQPQITRATLEIINVPIPTIEEQEKIVEKLDSAFAEIDLLEENFARSSDIIMEIEASLVANLWVKYAKELSKTHLDEVAQYKNGTAHEKIVDENGKFVIVNSKFISSNGLKFKKSSQQLVPLNIGDVVMVLSDVPNGKALAKCFLVDKDETYTLNQRICKLTSEVLLPEFLALNVNRNPYLLSFNNGENQTNLRLNDVLKTPIYFTDKKTQKIIVDEFVEAKNTIVGYSTLNMRKAESLLMLRQSLLSSVFSELGSYAS